MGLRRVLPLSMIAALFLSASAHAQGKPDPSSPKEQVDVCVASFEEAQLKQRRGKLVFARKLFNDCSANVCPRQLREDCAQHQDEIDKAVPTVVIVVRDSSGKDVDTKLKVDGAVFATEGGRAVPMDPGAHEIAYTVAGRSLVSKVTIYEGEKSRIVVLNANEGTTATSPAITPAPQNGRTAGAEAPSGSIVGPVILGGVGALLLIGGVAYFVLANNEASERDTQIAAANASTSELEKSVHLRSAESHDEAAANNQLLSVVVGGAGLVTIAGAVVWYVVTRPPTPAARLSPQVAPLIARGAVGASFSLSF